MPEAAYRGLIVDYGGVLTNPLRDTLDAFCAGDGIDPDALRAAVLHPESPIAALERGEIDGPEFERVLGERLGVEPEGLLRRMFAGFRAEPSMNDVLRAARRHGWKTALLSNSWANDYDRTGWDGLFDAVVISGEVGMRKPDPEIYLHTAELLGLAPRECVFVDDLPHNVRGAAAVGMVGIRHVDMATTARELEALTGLHFV